MSSPKEWTFVDALLSILLRMGVVVGLTAAVLFTQDAAEKAYMLLLAVFAQQLVSELDAKYRE